MLGIHGYWLFVLSGIVLNLTPGQDTFFILGNSLGAGRRAGIAAAVGIAAGCIAHAVGAALGLSAILATSATPFTRRKEPTTVPSPSSSSSTDLRKATQRVFCLREALAIAIERGVLHGEVGAECTIGRLALPAVDGEIPSGNCLVSEQQ
jgi:hypothetical protein